MEQNRRKTLQGIGVAAGIMSLSGCLWGGNSTDNGSSGEENDSTEEETLDESVEEEPDARDYEEIWEQVISNYNTHTLGEIDVHIDWETGDISEDNSRDPDISVDQSRTLRYNMDSEQFMLSEETEFGQKEGDRLTEETYNREMFYSDSAIYALINFEEDDITLWRTLNMSFEEVQSEYLSLPILPESVQTPDVEETEEPTIVEYTATATESEIFLNSVENSGYYIMETSRLSTMEEDRLTFTVNLSTLQVTQIDVEISGQTAEGVYLDSSVTFDFEYGSDFSYELPRPAEDAELSEELYHPER